MKLNHKNIFHNKVNIINNSIDNVVDELENLNTHCKILKNFTHKLNENEQNDYSNVINKINDSVKILNDMTYILEINKFKKILKTNSGNSIEVSEKKNKNINSNDLDNLNNSNDLDDTADDLDDTTDELDDLDDLDDSGDAKIQTIIKEDGFVNSVEFNANLCLNKKILCQIAYWIFNANVDLDKIKINKKSLKKFISQVSLYYHNNYYHNFKHAIFVLQFVHLLIDKIDIKNKLSQYEIFAILIAALIHDIDHPGNSNSFEINCQSNLALKYNNKSVLENHHCSFAFYLIHSKEIKLLENLNKNDFIIVRDMIVECVLTTDMKLHSNLIDDLNKKIYEKLYFDNIQDRIFLGKIIVHIADISNQIRPFDISFNVSNDLRKEYLLQVEKETKLGLSVSEHMKLMEDKIFYLSEFYFASNIVKPMWNMIVGIFPELYIFHENLDKNIVKWKELSNSN